jgi:hypothetical protein
MFLPFLLSFYSGNRVMSSEKMGKVFPAKTADKKLTELVAAALRQDYGDSTTAIKKIADQTGEGMHAIKRWFEGRNTPSANHLLILAKSSPSVLRVVLELVGDKWLLHALTLPKMEERGDNVTDQNSLVSKNEAEKKFPLRSDH